MKLPDFVWLDNVSSYLHGLGVAVLSVVLLMLGGILYPAVDAILGTAGALGGVVFYYNREFGPDGDYRKAVEAGDKAKMKDSRWDFIGACIGAAIGLLVVVARTAGW